MTIEVLVCAIAGDILNVTNLLAPERKDVSYLVSFQYQNDSELNMIPDDLRSRKDVRIVTTKSFGLSVNRNNAMSHSSGDILLFADDDNRYESSDFDRIQHVFEEHREADIVCFRSADYSGRLNREYPESSFNLVNQPSGYYVCSCEIVLRRRDGYPKFDEHYGLGSAFLACGEEEVFIHDALQAGFTAYYYPMTIVKTDRNTTGTGFNRLPAVRRSKGAVLAAIYGYRSAMLRVFKYAMLNVHGMSKFKALSDMMQGVRYAKSIGRC